MPRGAKMAPLLIASPAAVCCKPRWSKYSIFYTKVNRINVLVARQPSCPGATTTLAGFEAAGVGVLFGVLAQLYAWFWLSLMVVAGISSWARLLEVAARGRKLWAFISR